MKDQYKILISWYHEGKCKTKTMLESTSLSEVLKTHKEEKSKLKNYEYIAVFKNNNWIR
jgi:hypothetical protein